MLKNILIVMTTLLLVAGAGAGGYLYGTQGDANSVESKSPTDDLPEVMPNFPHFLKLSDPSAGADCSMDFTSGSAECVFPDGSGQAIYHSGDELNIHTFGGRGDDDGQCYTVPVPTLDASDDLDLEDTDSQPILQRVVNEDDRIKSWVIRVPDELNALAEDGQGVKELEYFEKDGEAWQVKYYEHGKTDPTVIDLGVGTQGITDDSSNAQCTPLEATDASDASAQQQGRSLIMAQLVSHTPIHHIVPHHTRAKQQGKRLGNALGVTVAATPAAAATRVGASYFTAAFCGPENPYGLLICGAATILGLVAMWVLAIACAGGCRKRRRRLLEAAPRRMLRVGDAALSAAQLFENGPALFRIGGEPMYLNAGRMLTSSAVTTALAASAVAAASAVGSTVPGVAVYA